MSTRRIPANYYPDSLVNRVSEAVIQRGAATLEDIAPDFPGTTKKQLHAALANASDRRRIQVKERGHAKGKLTVWEAGPGVRPGREPKPRIRVASVFGLSSPIEWTGSWPPLPAGRQVIHLEPWEA